MNVDEINGVCRGAIHSARGVGLRSKRDGCGRFSPTTQPHGRNQLRPYAFPMVARADQSAEAVREAVRGTERGETGTVNRRLRGSSEPADFVNP